MNQAILASALCPFAGGAIAADDSGTYQQLAKSSTPLNVETATGDTLRMTCAQSRAMVKGHDGVVLKTGATHFDRYRRKGRACDRKGSYPQPALVRTKDNVLCFIGYTCAVQED